MSCLVKFKLTAHRCSRGQPSTISIIIITNEVEGHHTNHILYKPLPFLFLQLTTNKRKALHDPLHDSEVSVVGLLGELAALQPHSPNQLTLLQTEGFHPTRRLRIQAFRKAIEKLLCGIFLEPV